MITDDIQANVSITNFEANVKVGNPPMLGNIVTINATLRDGSPYLSKSLKERYIKLKAYNPASGMIEQSRLKIDDPTQTEFKYIILDKDLISRNSKFQFCFPYGKIMVPMVYMFITITSVSYPEQDLVIWDKNFTGRKNQYFLTEDKSTKFWVDNINISPNNCDGFWVLNVVLNENKRTDDEVDAPNTIYRRKSLRIVYKENYFDSEKNILYIHFQGTYDCKLGVTSKYKYFCRYVPDEIYKDLQFYLYDGKIGEDLDLDNFKKNAIKINHEKNKIIIDYKVLKDKVDFFENKRNFYYIFFSTGKDFLNGDNNINIQSLEELNLVYNRKFSEVRNDVPFVNFEEKSKIDLRSTEYKEVVNGVTLSSQVLQLRFRHDNYRHAILLSAEITPKTVKGLINKDLNMVFSYTGEVDLNKTYFVGILFDIINHNGSMIVSDKQYFKYYATKNGKNVYRLEVSIPLKSIYAQKIFPYPNYGDAFANLMMIYDENGVSFSNIFPSYDFKNEFNKNWYKNGNSYDRALGENTPLLKDFYPELRKEFNCEIDYSLEFYFYLMLSTTCREGSGTCGTYLNFIRSFDNSNNNFLIPFAYGGTIENNIIYLKTTLMAFTDGRKKCDGFVNTGPTPTGNFYIINMNADNLELNIKENINSFCHEVDGKTIGTQNTRWLDKGIAYKINQIKHQSNEGVYYFGFSYDEMKKLVDFDYFSIADEKQSSISKYKFVMTDQWYSTTEPNGSMRNFMVYPEYENFNYSGNLAYDSNTTQYYKMYAEPMGSYYNIILETWLVKK